MCRPQWFGVCVCFCWLLKSMLSVHKLVCMVEYVCVNWVCLSEYGCLNEYVCVNWVCLSEYACLNAYVCLNWVCFLKVCMFEWICMFELSMFVWVCMFKWICVLELSMFLKECMFEWICTFNVLIEYVCKRMHVWINIYVWMNMYVGNECVYEYELSMFVREYFSKSASLIIGSIIIIYRISILFSHH